MDPRIEQAITRLIYECDLSRRVSHSMVAVTYQKCIDTLRHELSKPAPEHPIIKELEELGKDLDDEPDEGSQFAAAMLARIVAKHKGA